MIGGKLRRRAAVAGVTVVLTLAATGVGVSAVPLPPGLSPGPAGQPADAVGRWTQPFEEHGAGVPRCRPAGEEPPGRAEVAAGEDTGVACKPSAVEAAVLEDGRVFYFDGIGSGETPPGPADTSLAAEAPDSQARVLDLRTGTPTWAVPAGGGHGLSCSAVTALPDGKLLMAGGPDRRTCLFDPATGAFQPAAPMRHGRWYPHVAVGPDGNPTVFGGATRGVAGVGLGNARRTETYHSASDSWQENYVGPGSETTLPLQPRIVLAPHGQFFYAAAGQQWSPSGQAADDGLTAFFQFFDPDTSTWSVSGLAPLGLRSGAFVVPLTLKAPYDQMTLVTGGGVLGPAPGSAPPANALTTLTTIDGNGNVTNRNAGDLNHARWYSSAVLLPDGQVLAVGGTDRDDTFAPGLGVPVKTPELFDPTTTEWTVVASHRRPRGPDHTAVLLPDMRVLLGGGRDPSFEIWSPPYLFRGARPTITSVRRGVAHGETFTITTPDAALVESVLLLRIPSPDHGNDSDQRSLELEFTRSGETALTATAPPSGDVAPPGPYYLVVNKRSLQGPIPSVARMVDVGRSDPSEAPQPFPDDPPAPSGGSATPAEDAPLVATLPRRWLLPAR